MWIWDEAEGTRREFCQVKRQLEIVKTGHAIAEHDQIIAKEGRQMLQCRLDLYMDMNEELTQELKATY